MLKFYVMKRTEVVNIRYAACDVYIGRAGRGEDGYFRNPFRLLPGMSRGATLDRYRSYFYGRLRTDPEFRQRIHALKGKRLGCFCKPYHVIGILSKNISIPWTMNKSVRKVVCQIGRAHV